MSEDFGWRAIKGRISYFLGGLPGSFKSPRRRAHFQDLIGNGMPFGIHNASLLCAEPRDVQSVLGDSKVRGIIDSIHGLHICTKGSDLTVPI